MKQIEIESILQKIDDILQHISNSIRSDNIALLENTQPFISAILVELKQYQIFDAEASKEIINRLEKVINTLVRLTNLLKGRIDKQILFSAKAVRELEYLIGSIKHLVQCLKEASVTQNQVLIKYIIEGANNIENTADSFATQHQERLISGVCQPQASAIFIDLLNTIKENAYHLKELSRQISYLPLKEKG
jgi:Na+/phosphate symporter